jgi:hypothetical protein
MNLHVTNPYLDEWRAQLPSQQRRQEAALRAIERGDFAQLAGSRKYRQPLQNRYSYAIPTDEALTTISEFAPLIEIGAGTAYWAWLLRQMHVDIICYDNSPPSPDSTRNQYHPRSRCWTEVLKGDETKLEDHPERTLLLCWPPARDPMAYRALQRYRGDIFVGIFEPPISNEIKGSTGDERFLDLLQTGWSLVKQVEIPRWELCSDSLFVFRANR